MYFQFRSMQSSIMGKLYTKVSKAAIAAKDTTLCGIILALFRAYEETTKLVTGGKAEPAQLPSSYKETLNLNKTLMLDLTRETIG